MFDDLGKFGGTIVRHDSNKLRFTKDDQQRHVLDLGNFEGGNVIVAESQTGISIGTITSFAVLNFPSREKWHAFSEASKQLGISTSYFSKS